ncbi:DMT family transporter [Kitasatospora purpeofusca]|uniref:DMT family transporter n=1 Tax=Kitasatospora purpeofusca TaxID=67352 RepID=UPI0036E260C0
MLLGLTTALVATVCFGFGSVFQAGGAREAPPADRVRVGLLAALLRSWRFLLGTGLDIAGFALSIVALRTLPLFLVQAVTNASLAVTALAAARLLGARLHRADLLGIAAVVVGLTLLALGSGRAGRDQASAAFHWALLATTVLMLLLTFVLARRSGNTAAVGLGLLAGVGFGVTSLAVRVLDVSGPLDVFTDPAAYGLALGGLGGYLAYALALQRGTVTAVTAAGTVSETFGPALVGVVVLGDTARPGYAWCALTGFVVAVGGTFVLSRFGEVESELGLRPESAGPAAPESAGPAPSESAGPAPSVSPPSGPDATRSGDHPGRPDGSAMQR